MFTNNLFNIESTDVIHIKFVYKWTHFRHQSDSKQTSTDQFSGQIRFFLSNVVVRAITFFHFSLETCSFLVSDILVFRGAYCGGTYFSTILTNSLGWDGSGATVRLL
jgi:hypothetical protein